MSSEAKVHPAEEINASSSNPLTRIQVRLRTNKKFKMIVACTTLIAVFVDILGTALVMPVLPALCSYAEGGPYHTIMAKDLPLDIRKSMVAELINPDAFNDPAPPFKFSLAMNFVMSFGQLGSALGSMTFGRMCDYIGCKIPMQICVFNGIIGYLIVYAAGKWAKSYWLFAFGIFWNNFFGNTMGVASVYMPRLFAEGPERDSMVAGVLGMGLVGGSVGSLIVMPFVTQPKNGENFFNAVWLALGLTCATFLAVCFVLVPQPKMSEKEQKEANEKANEKTPNFAKRLLIMTLIASALDSAGDEGTRMARGTIISAVFPEWSTTERQNYLLLALLVIIIVAMILLTCMRKCLNLASIATIGCLFTLGTQLVLMVEWGAGPYIAIWHVGKLMGFLSTLASGFIIQDVAPQNLLGLWNGRNEALSNIAAGVAPLIFAPVYDAIGNRRGQEMLGITSGVSLLATVAYAPLIAMMPKKKQTEEQKELERQKWNIDGFAELSDVEYQKLPLEKIDMFFEKCMAEGTKPRIVSWGDYAAERPHLVGKGGLQERATKDFEYVSSQIMAVLTDRSLLRKEAENHEKFDEIMPKFDRDRAKNEMGAWIADYFDDAGYDHWETQTTIYKAMLLNAFPPIDALDDVKPDWSKKTLDEWEEALTKFLSIMDDHIGSSKRRAQAGISAGSWASLLKRR